MAIYSLEVERHVVGGIIRNPQAFPEVERFLSEKDFYNDLHSALFCLCRDILISGKQLDKVILAQKVKDSGVSFNEDINVFQYIDSISRTQINEKGLIESAKELLKIRIRRDIFSTAGSVQKYVKSCAEEDIDKIIAETDSLYNEKIKSYEFEDEPIDLADGLEDMVEELGNNPVEESGLITPFNMFNEIYGGLKEGNLYAIVSRPSHGKSTFLNSMAYGACQINGLKTLYLDTEMNTKEQQFRLIASLSGVPLWYVETGNWRRNEDYTTKVRNAFKKLKETGIHHIHVGNKNIDQICSLVRRWYFKHVGRGNKCLICYDYVKLTGESVGQNWAEHQAIGEKIDKLKKLSEELTSPIFTAMQMNRSGESHNKKSHEISDDSSAIALSDRLQWFASFVAIFRRKTLDEIELDGDRFGTHKLIPVKTRWQGKSARGHHDIIKRTFPDGRESWVNNYLNFSVENFNVVESGSLQDIIDAQSEVFELNDQQANNERPL